MKQSSLLVLSLVAFVAIIVGGCSTDENNFPCLTCPGPNPAIEVARQYLADNQDLWPMRAGLDEWRFGRMNESSEYSWLTFYQYYRGVPVVNGRANITVSLAGNVDISYSSFIPNVDVNIRPKVSKYDAMRVAESQVLAESTISHRQIVDDPRILALDGRFYLCWQIALQTRNGSEFWTYWIDAHSNEVVHKYGIFADRTQRD